ncbi:MAG: hypothetical protein OEV64_09205 [Desulfobulbaceae bacterium]|nr:hypothetical protein [Desulfobulbaceae bacterium]
MIDLKQKELAEWQDRNFPRSKYDHLDREQLLDMVLLLQCALGMAEEVGEVCHHVLKGTQGIRGGANGMNKKEIADGVADTGIFGLQLLSRLDVDAESEISEVTEAVLSRDWKENPAGAGNGDPVQKC